MSRCHDLLTAMAERLGRVNASELVDLTGLTHRQVMDGLRDLGAKGYAERLGTVDGYQITPKGREFLLAGREYHQGPKGPYEMTFGASTLRERLWKALRLEQRATLPELLVLAGRDEEGIPEDAKKYINALVRAGHLTRRGFKDGERHSIFVLVNDTGPKPPQFNKSQGRVYDPNTKKIHNLRDEEAANGLA